MRKILLATTALIGFAAAGTAQAATSPLNVTVGGSVDFLAGAFHESKAVAADVYDAGTANREGHADFETLYTLNFGVTGKASNGIEYGGNLKLDNYPDVNDEDGAFTGSSNRINVTQADIFLSGAYGKLQLGDSRGATEMVLTAPVVGEGQVYGRYIDFLDSKTFVKTIVTGLDGTEHATNVTYFTPKVGTENHKVQAGVTFSPNSYDYGSNVVKYDGNTLRPYKNEIKGAAAYTGNFAPVKVGASAHIISATSDTGAGNNKYRDFVAWGVGAEAAAYGFTLGGNYVDLGHAATVGDRNKDQQQYGAGLKYEINKIALGVSYLGGEGYDRFLDLTGNDYIKHFNSYGAGAAYTWAPGLTTNVDGVLFGQKNDVNIKNDGYVLLLSQKLAF